MGKKTMMATRTIVPVAPRPSSRTISGAISTQRAPCLHVAIGCSGTMMFTPVTIISDGAEAAGRQCGACTLMSPQMVNLRSIQPYYVTRIPVATARQLRVVGNAVTQMAATPMRRVRGSTYTETTARPVGPR